MDARNIFFLPRSQKIRKSERVDVEEDEETTHYFYANLMFQLQSIDTKKKHKARCKVRVRGRKKRR